MQQLAIETAIVRDPAAAKQLAERIAGAGAPVSAAEPSREIDWSQFPSYDQLSNPFDPEKLKRLAAASAKSRDQTRSLMFLILQAAVEKATQFRPLLKDEKLKESDDEHHSIALALAAYDYSINGNKGALQYIADELAKEPIGSDAQAAVPLGFIDEWELTMGAHEKHFAQTDGAGAVAAMLFWEQRKHLFPENYARFQSGRLAAAKLDAKSLQGVWIGEKEGVSVNLRMGEHTRWEVRKGDTLIKAELTTHPWENGRGITIMAPREVEGRVPCGRFRREASGALQIDIWPDTSEKTPYPRVSDLVLALVSGEQPRSGELLQPSTEQKLKWGEPVNGLRMALVWPPTLGEPGIGDAEEVFLVVQNVSETGVRFTTGEGAPNPRRLMMLDNGRPLQAIRDPVPTPGDFSDDDKALLDPAAALLGQVLE